MRVLITIESVTKFLGLDFADNSLLKEHRAHEKETLWMV